MFHYEIIRAGWVVLKKISPHQLSYFTFRYISLFDNCLRFYDKEISSSELENELTIEDEIDLHSIRTVTPIQIEDEQEKPGFVIELIADANPVELRFSDIDTSNAWINDIMEFISKDPRQKININDSQDTKPKLRSLRSTGMGVVGAIAYAVGAIKKHVSPSVEESLTTEQVSTIQR
jgi:hypothetical protein